MDRNEFWALTGSSMSSSIQEENPVTVSRKDVEGDYLSLRKRDFSVVLIEHGRGRSFREFEFLKSCER